MLAAVDIRQLILELYDDNNQSYPQNFPVFSKIYILLFGSYSLAHLFLRTLIQKEVRARTMSLYHLGGVGKYSLVP
jgi:hypothetical protein